MFGVPAAVILNKESLEKSGIVKVGPPLPPHAVISDKAVQLVGCGPPAGPDVLVKIVDPDKQTLCNSRTVGEIWVTGNSKTAGYWGQKELTDETFHARYLDANGTQSKETFLRTGDLGMKSLCICYK